MYKIVKRGRFVLCSVHFSPTKKRGKGEWNEGIRKEKEEDTKGLGGVCFECLGKALCKIFIKNGDCVVIVKEKNTTFVPEI